MDTTEQGAAVERLAAFMGYEVFPGMGFDVGACYARGGRPAYWDGRGKRRRFVLEGARDGWNPFTDANAEQQLAEHAVAVLSPDQLTHYHARVAAACFDRRAEHRLRTGQWLERDADVLFLRTGDRAAALAAILGGV